MSHVVGGMADKVGQCFKILQYFDLVGGDIGSNSQLKLKISPITNRTNLMVIGQSLWSQAMSKILCASFVQTFAPFVVIFLFFTTKVPKENTKDTQRKYDCANNFAIFLSIH